MKAELLAFVRSIKQGQMTLSRNGPDSYPDPAKTSYNDMVSWNITIRFGYGYFTGAVVHYEGRWTTPRDVSCESPYKYAEAERELSVEEAVDTFLGNTIPDWTIPK